MARSISRLGVTLVCCLAAAVLLIAGTASATPATGVSMTLLRNGPPDWATTTWSAEGAISDAGTWTIDRFICGACPSPTTGAFNWNATLASVRGTMTLRLRAVFNQSVDMTFWEVVGGTGEYAQVQGHGTYSVSVDEVGVRHIVLDGELDSK